MSELAEKELAAIEDIIENIFQSSKDELRRITDSVELEKYWHFKFDDEKSLAINMYEFINLLNLYSAKCRQWEEMHNGTCCVVERVRDKYILPKIKQFIKDDIEKIYY